MSLRKLFVSAAFAKPVDLSGRKIIVTGTAPGSIGFETARVLANWGAAVTISTRSNTAAVIETLRARLPEHRRSLIDGHELDLAQTASVRGFADWYTQKHAALDVLVNNAGVHLDLLSHWKQPKLSADGHEIQWRINYLGPAQLTQLLLPLLRKSGQASGDARVVNVVSMLHSKGNNAALFTPPQRYNSWAAYGTSKLALMHMSSELQRREAGNHVQAYSLHPGAVYTNIADKGLAGHPAIESLRKLMAPVEAYFLLTPEEGAQTSAHCATAQGLTGGQYYDQCAPGKASTDALDTTVSARLWEQTQGWINSLAP